MSSRKEVRLLKLVKKDCQGFNYNLTSLVSPKKWYGKREVCPIHRMKPNCLAFIQLVLETVDSQET